MRQYAEQQGVEDEVEYDGGRVQGQKSEGWKHLVSLRFYGERERRVDSDVFRMCLSLERRRPVGHDGIAGREEIIKLGWSKYFNIKIRRSLNSLG